MNASTYQVGSYLAKHFGFDNFVHPSDYKALYIYIYLYLLYLLIDVKENAKGCTSQYDRLVVRIPCLYDPKFNNKNKVDYNHLLYLPQKNARNSKLSDYYFDYGTTIWMMSSKDSP